MKKTPWYFVLSALLIIALSIVILVVGVPEESVIISDDQVLTVTGLTRESQNITINTVGSFIYNVEPGGGVLSEPLTLNFDISDAEDRDFDVALYWYDEDVLMWQPISQPLSTTQTFLEAERYRLGLFSIREYLDVTTPEFVSTYDELLQMAPESTVGYRIEVGFISNDGSAIKLNSLTQTGGCGGVVLNGNTTQKSQLEDSARVLINDVETEVDFIFVGLWYTGDGCVDDSFLEPTSM